MTGKDIPIALIACIITGLLAPAAHAVWSVETVDSVGNPGEYCSIALSGSNLPRIAYLKAQTEDLRYASYNGSSWSFETLDASEDCGYFASLALTTDGYARIAYCRDPGMAQWDLKVAIESVSGWEYHFIDPLFGPTGDFLDLTLDADGYPHASYLGYNATESKRTLNWGLQDGTGFYFGPIEETFDIEEGQTSIALSASGAPHILAFDGTNNDPRYHYYLGGTWHAENISGANQGDYSSMDLDSSDHAHVAFNNRSAGELVYGYRGSIGWEVESVTELMGYGWVSLIMDDADRPHIAFYTGGNLRYAYKGPSGWAVETVDSDGDVGLRCSVDLDGVGAPHIAYRDETNQALKYAFKLTPT